MLKPTFASEPRPPGSGGNATRLGALPPLPGGRGSEVARPSGPLAAGAGPGGVGEDEVDQLLAAEEALPVIVSLALGDPQGHPPAELLVAACDLAGILLQRHGPVDVAMDVEDGDAGPGQRRQPLDRV